MKVKLENGERLVVEVPIGNVIAYVAVTAEPIPGKLVPTPLVDVTVENGLVGEIKEHVCRHPSGGHIEDRLVLWGHLVSAHAGIFSLQATLEELLDMHEHEHTGPGTIRNHPRESRGYSLAKIGRVLAESDDEGPETPSTKRPTVPLKAVDHEYLASYSGGREVGCHICRKPRSAHPIG